MGGVCSGGVAEENATIGGIALGFSRKPKKVKKTEKQKKDSSFSSTSDSDGTQRKSHSSESQSISALSKTAISKVAPRNTFLGMAGIAGIERAVELLETIGNSVSNLNTNGGFPSGMASRGGKISILAFEVANTIIKGANLLQSLSEESMELLKKEVLQSEGVQLLVSMDTEELLRLAAADKRQEFDVFAREVVRFGDQCKDPQWHHLDRYFSRLDADDLGYKSLKVEAEAAMQELTTLAWQTCGLYHELHTLDRFEQDYKKKLEEWNSSNPSWKGDSLQVFLSELNIQRKTVRSLKKKSLWFKNLEEIVDKLVTVVTYIHQSISEAFALKGKAIVAKQSSSGPPQRLGEAGLALHYATVINLINSMASRPTSLPSYMRDTLYRGLPRSVKTALRCQLQALDPKEELTVSRVRAEMDKTLQWIVPVAANTSRAHQAFGWVGEWANSGSECGKFNLIRLQTLYHADIQKTELYILQLVTWLHHLIILIRQQKIRFKPIRTGSPTAAELVSYSNAGQLSETISGGKTHKAQLSGDRKKAFNEVLARRGVQRISKSLDSPKDIKKDSRVWAVSRSAFSSPNREFCDGESSGRQKSGSLDMVDGLN